MPARQPAGCWRYLVPAGPRMRNLPPMGPYGKDPEMTLEPNSRQIDRRFPGDTAALLGIAAIVGLVHVFTNGRYGFHRDELQVLSDARHLDWGFVPYPPLTPFVEWVGLSIFGLSLVGLRLFSVIAQAFAVMVTGLMARELGGGGLAQATAALAIALSPLPLFEGTEFQYTTFDYLWWVLIAYFVIRLLKTENPRWWLAIGATLGIGFQTKYTMGFYFCGIMGGVLLTRAPVSGKPVVLGWDGAGADHLSLQSGVAGEAWIHLAAFPRAHSCSRCAPGSCRWVSTPAILDLHESFCGAVMDRRTAGLFARSTMSAAGLDVFDPAGALLGGQGTKLLPCRGVSDVDGDGRGDGRALGRFADEADAADRRGRVLHLARGVRALHERDRCSVGTERGADEFCAEEQW